ncbi:unannotated protein [freshwater metagenome]|uniref:Unannotated protein n=1 Tax=freshwater metagenome TaxID=449393 RepID=A0A6J7NQ22_9ZZZZ
MMSISTNGRDRETTIAHHHCRHAVPTRIRTRGIPEHLGIHMRMTVDETGCNHIATSIDLDLPAFRNFTNARDSSVGDSDIGDNTQRPGAVNDTSVANNKIEVHEPPLPFATVLPAPHSCCKPARIKGTI